MLMRLVGLSLILPSLPGQQPDFVLKAPTAETFTAWRAHILPDRSELGFAAIPWLPAFGEGVREAGRQKRPLLFYAMNGHPLGCT